MEGKTQKGKLQLADLLQDAQRDSHFFLGGRCQRQTGMAQLDAGDGFDSGTQDGVGQDTAVLTGGLAEAVDGNEQVLCLFVVALCEGLEDGADLVTEDVGAAGDQTLCALHDGGQQHDVVTVVDHEVGVNSMSGQHEVGDLSGVDAGFVHLIQRNEPVSSLMPTMLGTAARRATVSGSMLMPTKMGMLYSRMLHLVASATAL